MAVTTRELKITARHLTLFGALALILGFAAISAPFIAGPSVVTTVGVLMIAGGIMAMRCKRRCRAANSCGAANEQCIRAITRYCNV